ncbi:hypothetical protein CLIB1423_07S02300 [[Candida] railenensis]|uniref:Zn(2)-C6 fungal-type domain-containing protein n=1 Tax=[Candida] railenensis TaxID=45579 RepID=A0A9P0QNM4_9ASCO|nr:hypothetical protein CLIB1423_07S02300 [[Candida] railenensis]
MDSIKPKRQRRSYACGPCKLLKIKCDLQTPCSGCLKFKRAEKCLEDPPQPPSAEELSKTLERKKKSMNRKQSSPTDSTSSGETKRAYGQSPPDSQDHHLPSHPQGVMPSIASSIGQSSPQQPSPLPIVNNKLPRIHHRPVHQASPSAFPQQYPYQYSQKYPYVHALPSAPSGQAPINSHPSPAYPHLNVHQIQQQQQPQQPPSQPQSMTQNKPVYFPAPIIRYDYPNQPPIPVGDPIIPPAQPKKLHNRTTLHEFTLSMTSSDLTTLIALFPSTFEECKSLVDIAISSQSPLFRYDKDILMEEYTRFINLYKNQQVLQPLTDFNIHTARNISILLVYLAVGSLFTGKDLLLDRIEFAKHLKSILSRYDTVEEIQYLIDFYFSIRDYFYQQDLVSEHFLEFNQLLGCILLNDEFMDLITERPIYSANRLAIRSWTKLRAIQIEFPYFESRGTLLSLWQFKDSILPHREVINYAFYCGNDSAAFAHEEVMIGPGFGPELAHGATKFFIDIWAVYYKRAEQSTLIKDIVRSYLELYGEVYNLTSKELAKYEAMKKRNDISRATLTSKSSLLMLIKNQVTLSLFTRWLSFVRIESTYFPSLRYASYITSILSLFNHFRFVAESCPNDDIIKLISDEFGLFIFHYFQICMIFQAIFNATLCNFLDLPTSNNILNLQEIYDKNLDNLKFTVDNFKRSSIYTQYLSKVQTHTAPIGIVEVLIEIAPGLIKKRCMTFHEFIEVINSKFDSNMRKFIVQRQFGSEDAFKRYLEKVWDLFSYLTKEEQGKDKIMITKELYLDMDLINDCKDKFNGIVFTKNLVNDYMRDVSEPNLAQS